MHAFERERKKESAAMKLRKNMCINSKRVQGKHKKERKSKRKSRKRQQGKTAKKNKRQIDFKSSFLMVQAHFNLSKSHSGEGWKGGNSRRRTASGSEPWKMKLENAFTAIFTYLNPVPFPISPAWPACRAIGFVLFEFMPSQLGSPFSLSLSLLLSLLLMSFIMSVQIITCRLDTTMRSCDDVAVIVVCQTARRRARLKAILCIC